MEKVKIYSQLKADIIALKEYAVDLQFPSIATSFSIDDVLSEMNDLLLGIENGQLVLPYKELKLVSAYYVTDGVFDDNVKLKEMIFQIQNDIYSIRKYIVVQQKPWYFFRRKYENVNWLFPNLKLSRANSPLICFNLSLFSGDKLAPPRTKSS